MSSLIEIDTQPIKIDLIDFGLGTQNLGNNTYVPTLATLKFSPVAIGKFDGSQCIKLKNTDAAASAIFTIRGGNDADMQSVVYTTRGQTTKSNSTSQVTVPPASFVYLDLTENYWFVQIDATQSGATAFSTGHVEAGIFLAKL